MLALGVLELDFCVVERARTRAILNETDECNESEQRAQVAAAHRLSHQAATSKPRI